VLYIYHVIGSKTVMQPQKKHTAPIVKLYSGRDYFPAGMDYPIEAHKIRRYSGP
jgi:hypothetical protein